MHYKLLLFTGNLPKETEIEDIMQKYSWDNIKYDENDNIIGDIPLFTYDYYTIGGRYKGSLKLNVEGNEDYYKWGFYEREKRNKRLFYSCTLSIMEKYITPSFMFSEEDYFVPMGFRDGYLYVDGARMCDIIKDKSNFDCYIALDKNNQIIRSHWNGDKWIDDDNFDLKFEQMLKDNNNSFVTVLDIHD